MPGENPSGCLHFNEFVAGVSLEKQRLGMGSLRPRGLNSAAQGECNIPTEFASFGWTEEEWESYVKYLEWAQFTLGKHIHPTHGSMPICVAKNVSERKLCNGINPPSASVRE